MFPICNVNYEGARGISLSTSLSRFFSPLSPSLFLIYFFPFITINSWTIIVIVALYLQLFKYPELNTTRLQLHTSVQDACRISTTACNNKYKCYITLVCLMLMSTSHLYNDIMCHSPQPQLSMLFRFVCITIYGHRLFGIYIEKLSI